MVATFEMHMHAMPRPGGASHSGLTYYHCILLPEHLRRVMAISQHGVLFDRDANDSLKMFRNMLSSHLDDDCATKASWAIS
jgi:hypothetical protein